MADVGVALDAGRLRVAIVRLSRELRRHGVAGLTPTQMSTLATVDRRGSMRLGDLAASEGITPSTLTRLVAALEERGYLERSADPADARSSRVMATPQAHELMDRLRSETVTALAERMNVLTPEQRQALTDALPALERLADVPVHR